MAMDAERRQAELIGQFSAQAAALSSAPQLAALVLEATSHPALFAFSELLTLPALSKVRPPSASASSARPWRSPPGVGLGFNYFPPSPRRLRGVRLDLTLVCDWLFRLFVGAARWHAVRVVTGRPPALCLRHFEGLQE